MTRNDYQLHLMILQQQRILHAQQEDLRRCLYIAQRIPFLENILTAKDAEIQHLQTALTRRN